MGEHNENQPQPDLELSESEKRNGIGALYHHISSYFDEPVPPSGWKKEEARSLYGTIGEYLYESDTEDWYIEELVPQQLFVRRRKPSVDPKIDEVAFMTINDGKFGSHDISYGSINVNRSSGDVISSPPMKINTHRALELGNILARALTRQE